MIAHPSGAGRSADSPSPMAGWRRWLFNRLARWEEASVARSLGLPVERLVLVDLSDNHD